MVLKTDEKGFIINEGDLNNIPERLLPILKEMVTFSKKELGNNFLSAYVRGSVSVGRFIDSLSDIDFVVVSKLKASAGTLKKFLNYSIKMDDSYPWVKGFDLFLVDNKTLFESPELNKLRVYLATQSALLEGADIITNKLPRNKADENLSKTLLLEIDKEFEFLKKIFSTDINNFSYNNRVRSLDFWCIWMSRVVLRFSLYASLKKHRSYTNDLIDCYQIVSKIYPEFEPDLKLALSWSQNPINDKITLRSYLERVFKKIKDIYQN